MKKVRLIPVLEEEIKKLRVVAYCHVSIKRKAQRTSLMNQICYYTEQILNHEDWQFAGVYYDFGKSGLRKKVRIGLEQMLRQVEK